MIGLLARFLDRGQMLENIPFVDDVVHVLHGCHTLFPQNLEHNPLLTLLIECFIDFSEVASADNLADLEVIDVRLLFFS